MDKQTQGDSYTFTVIDNNGFHGLYTLRQKGAEDLLVRVKEASQQLIIEGFVPVEKFKSYSQTAPKTTEEKCSKCGADMLISKRSGKPYCSKKCWLEQTY